MNMKKTVLGMASVAALLGSAASNAAVSTMVFTSFGNNFTMMDEFGQTFGGTNDVRFSWDGTYATSVVASPASSALTRNALISSPTQFQGNAWTAHHVTIFKPGTYTVYDGCNTTGTTYGSFGTGNAYNAGCGLGNALTFTVAPGQLGAHMLFNWSTNTDIDVIDVWNANSAFGPSGMWTGALNTVGNTTSKVWSLMSSEFDGDGINGKKMTDGPFLGKGANFNLMNWGPASYNLDVNGNPVACAAASCVGGIRQATGWTAGGPNVPVPAAVWLFGSGLLGLVGVARRKKKLA